MNSLENNIARVNTTLQQKKQTHQTEIGLAIIVCLILALTFRFYHHRRNKLKNNYMYPI